MSAYRAAVVTVSDRVHAGTRVDRSGVVVGEALTDAGFVVARREVVPDDRDTIVELLERLMDDVRLVVTTGGTGFAPRDVTPEATLEVVDRRAPGLAEAMRAAGRASTPLADLSRGVAGIAGGTLIVNLPGSPDAAVENLGAVLPVFNHALDLLAGRNHH